MGIHIKTPEQISIMQEGGSKLSEVKKALVAAVAEGVNAMDIENMANDLIKQAGGEASFKKVPGYTWATCINVNEGVVHGIPKKDMVFKKGDLVSIDVGMFYKGFHTDTSTTVLVGDDKNKQKFLKVGRTALDQSIHQAQPGNKIYDVSKTIQQVVEDAGWNVIRALTGHGVGKNLHEDPYIPCFVRGNRDNSPEIVPGMVLAIEVMYTQGNPEVETQNDSWTIQTADGKISALFEETVAVTQNGPIVLTGGSK